MVEVWTSVAVVEVDVGWFLVVVFHGCEAGFGWFVVVLVGIVYGVVFGVVRGTDDVHVYYDCVDINPPVSLHEYFSAPS